MERQARSSLCCRAAVVRTEPLSGGAAPALLLTGSPGVRMLERERQAVVDGCQLDDGILHKHPVCFLQE